MKYAKMLGLLAIAAAALMAFVGTASATVTAGGATYTGAIKAESTNSQLDGSVTISCSKSVVEGSISNGATSGTVTNLTFSECGTATVDVVGSKQEPNHGGTLEVTSSGTVKSTGAKVTVVTHNFLGTVHCIYKTNGTTVGTLTEGVAPGVMHIGSSAIPEEATDGLCGNDAVWTGTYTLKTPSSAIVVH